MSLDALLDRLVAEPLAEVPVDVMPEDQFRLLTDEVNNIKTKLENGGEASVEDARKIVVWFRARRQKNFVLTKPKEPKVKAERKTPVRRTTKQPALTAEEALALLNKQIGEL